MEGKRLYRSTGDKVIFGVAGGIAEYFEVDPTLVRIIFVILAVWGGVGVLLYLLGAILIPEEPKEGVTMAEKKGAKKAKKDNRPIESKIETAADDVKKGYETRKWQGEQLFGMIVLGLGVIFLLEAFIPGFSFGKLWPLILIGIGLWLLAGREEK